MKPKIIWFLLLVTNAVDSHQDTGFTVQSVTASQYSADFHGVKVDPINVIDRNFETFFIAYSTSERKWLKLQLTKPEVVGTVAIVNRSVF